MPLALENMWFCRSATMRLFTQRCGAAFYLNEGSFENRKEQRVVHGEALCRMMEALTDDKRFTDRIHELMQRQKEKEDIIMCEYIDMLEARGEAQGVIKGANKLAALLLRLYSLGREEDAKQAVADEDIILFSYHNQDRRHRLFPAALL